VMVTGNYRKEIRAKLSSNDDNNNCLLYWFIDTWNVWVLFTLRIFFCLSYFDDDDGLKGWKAWGAFLRN
jgi:hypothetical protein